MLLICFGIVIMRIFIVAEVEVINIRGIERGIYGLHSGVADRSCGQSAALVHIIKAVVAVDVTADIGLDPVLNIIDARIHLKLHARVKAVIYNCRNL